MLVLDLGCEGRSSAKLFNWLGQEKPGAADRLSRRRGSSSSSFQASIRSGSLRTLLPHSQTGELLLLFNFEIPSRHAISSILQKSRSSERLLLSTTSNTYIVNYIFFAILKQISRTYILLTNNFGVFSGHCIIQV